MIERIFTRTPNDGTTREHATVHVVEGAGIEGDRYFDRHEEPGQNITLVEAEEIERFLAAHGRPLDLSVTGRNLVTRGVRLNELVGKEFKVGAVVLRGVELCEPCLGLGEALAAGELTPAAVVKAFVHRAGLRADVVSSGSIAVGARLTFTGAATLPIVAVQEQYAASYRECLDVVAREKKYLAQIEALPLEKIAGFVKDSVANDAIQFFALDGERVVGWADVFPNWAHAVAHGGSLGMGVLPEYRGRGLGRRLLAACIEKAWRKGLTRIELEARADNLAAISLYEKLGFEHEALKARAMRFDGVYFDAVQMRLLHAAA